jgi:hypothetical protein
MSFDSMAGRPAEDQDTEFTDLEPAESSVHIDHDMLDVTGTPLPIPPAIQPLQRAVQRQQLFPGAPAPEPTTSRASKRCAPCVKSMCLRRLECNGRGGKNLCTCDHPPMAKGERARISEATIIAYWAQRGQNI